MTEDAGQTWYLSFVDPDKPVGERWLGGCFVRAPTMIAAVPAAHRQGCNPGGEVKIVPVSAAVQVPEQWFNRLLDRTALDAMDAEMLK